MSIEDNLLSLGREHDNRIQDALSGMLLEPPAQLGRELRSYLASQVDHGKMKQTDEKVVQLSKAPNHLEELVCSKAEFSSGAWLEFNIQFEWKQQGWVVRSFEYHLYLPSDRKIRMLRLHLNSKTHHDPHVVPRCHLHIDDSQAHVPFTPMDPRLILFLICESVEPDFGK